MKNILIDLSSFSDLNTISQAIKIFDLKKKKDYNISVRGTDEDLIRFKSYPDIKCVEKETPLTPDSYDYIFIADHSEITNGEIDYTVLFETGNDTCLYIFEHEILFELCKDKKRIGILTQDKNLSVPEENRFEIIDPEVLFSGAFDAIFMTRREFEWVKSIMNGILKKINDNLSGTRTVNALASYFFKNYISQPKVFQLKDFIRENRVIYIDGVPYYVPANTNNETEILNALKEAIGE